MTKCMMNEAAMAVIREGFRQGGITNKLWFSLKLKDKNTILMVYKIYLSHLQSSIISFLATREISYNQDAV